jgi:hypothetical protein
MPAQGRGAHLAAPIGRRQSAGTHLLGPIGRRHIQAGGDDTIAARRRAAAAICAGRSNAMPAGRPCVPGHQGIAGALHLAGCSAKADGDRPACHNTARLESPAGCSAECAWQAADAVGGSAHQADAFIMMARRALDTEGTGQVCVGQPGILY